MPKLSELVNCDVICLNDGALRGKVANVYFDENCRKIVYFDLTCAEGKVLLPFAAAACVRDAVTAENALPFLAHGDADLTSLIPSPLGKKVYTASGRARGKVTELLFSAKGKVTALETETSSYSPSAFAVFGDVLILKEGRNGKRRSPSAVFPEPKEDYPVAVLRDDSPSPSLSSPPQFAAAANAPRSGADIRAGYANTLLNLSATRARLPGTPLAFGESDAKTRITNVLRYRRPALWLSAVASLVCLLAAACALTSRAQETAPTVPHGTYGVRDILYAAPVFSFSYASAEDAPQYAVDETGTLLERGGLSSMDGKHEADEWVPLGALQRTDFDAVSFSALFPVPNYPETFSPDVVAADVAAVWALAPTAGSAQDALLLETHGGEMLLLLASGSLKADGTHARWLFALNDAGVPFDTVAIERSIGESLSLSQPVRCFAYYTDPGAPSWYLIAWICGDDMGYSILTCNEASGACQLQGNTLLQGAAVSDAPVLCGPHLGEEGQEIRLDAILSNDPLLASVARTADGARETRAVSGAPSLTIFPTTDGPIELGYSYREQAGAIDAPADQAGGQS